MQYGMVDVGTMTEGRGLLTKAERAAIAGEKSASYRYKTRSYTKRRIAKIEEDVAVLAHHDQELLEDLRDVVCKPTGSER